MNWFIKAKVCILPIASIPKKISHGIENRLAWSADAAASSSNNSTISAASPQNHVARIFAQELTYNLSSCRQIQQNIDKWLRLKPQKFHAPISIINTNNLGGFRDFHDTDYTVRRVIFPSTLVESTKIFAPMRAIIKRFSMR